MSTTFPPQPFLRPSLLRPAAQQQRDARGRRGGSGGAARCHAAPRALPLLRRPRPRGSPGRAGPAALPARRACPPAPGRSPGSGLERIRSRRWRCRAAGSKEFTGALRCRGNVCASSCASQPGASLGTAAAGSTARAPRAAVTFWVCLVPQKLSVLARFRSLQGSVIHPDLKDTLNVTGP